MANRIKKNVGIDANASNVGGWSIASKEGMGPSSSTGFFNGLQIPTGGYALYSSNIDARIASNDDELIEILNKMGASIAVDDLARGLEWAKNNDVLIINSNYSNVVTDGLIMNVESKHNEGYYYQVPTTNLLSSGDPNSNIAWTNSGEWTINNNATDIEKPFTNHGGPSNVLTILRGQSVTTGSQHWGCAGFSGLPSTTYTISVWFRQSRAGSNQPYFRTNVNNNSLGNFNWNGDTNAANWPVNQWIRISCTATLQSNETGAYLSNYIGGEARDIVWYYAPMVELGSIMSPFVHGSRSENNAWIDLTGNGNHAYKGQGEWNAAKRYWDSKFDPAYYGGKDRLQFNVSHSASLNDAMAKTSGGWVIEELVRIDDNTYPEAAAGAVISGGYGSGSIGFDWNHGVYNTAIRMGLADGSLSNYTIDASWPLPSKFQTLGKWYRRSFFWNRDNNTMGVYYNGELIGTTDISLTAGKILYDGGGISFGEMYGWCHDGARAEIKLYNRILSQEEVSQNVHGGPIVTNGLTFAADAGNLICYESGSTSMYSLADSLEGTLVNGTGWNSSNGGFWEFDNSNDKIIIPNNAAFNHTSQLTIESWVRFDGNSDDFIFEKGDVNTQYSLFSHGTDIVFRTYHAGDGGYDTFAPNKTEVGIVNGQWHHIVGSWDGSTKRIYVDGVERRSKSKSGALVTTSKGAAIGAFGGDTSGYYFGGDIAIVRIYNKGLSTSEVLQNYNAHVTRFK